MMQHEKKKKINCNTKEFCSFFVYFTFFVIFCVCIKLNSSYNPWQHAMRKPLVRRLKSDVAPPTPSPHLAQTVPGPHKHPTT
jgi:hypothetical protein